MIIVLNYEVLEDFLKQQYCLEQEVKGQLQWQGEYKQSHYRGHSEKSEGKGSEE